MTDRLFSGLTLNQSGGPKEAEEEWQRLAVLLGLPHDSFLVTYAGTFGHLYDFKTVH